MTSTKVVSVRIKITCEIIFQNKSLKHVESVASFVPEIFLS